jgi:hypothetical protein
MAPAAESMPESALRREPRKREARPSAILVFAGFGR